MLIVWQRVEDYVVQPLVYGRAVHVNPLVTIISPGMVVGKTPQGAVDRR